MLVSVAVAFGMTAKVSSNSLSDASIYCGRIGITAKVSSYSLSNMLPTSFNILCQSISPSQSSASSLVSRWRGPLKAPLIWSGWDRIPFLGVGRGGVPPAGVGRNRAPPLWVGWSRVYFLGVRHVRIMFDLLYKSTYYFGLVIDRIV